MDLSKLVPGEKGQSVETTPVKVKRRSYVQKSGREFEKVECGKPAEQIVPLVDFPSVWPSQYKGTSVEDPEKKVKFLRCQYPGCVEMRARTDNIWSHVAEDHMGRKALCPRCKGSFANPGSMKSHLKANECMKGPVAKKRRAMATE